MTSCCRRLSEPIALAASSPAVAAFLVALARATDWPCATALKTKIAIEAASMRRFIGGFVIIWLGSSRWINRNDRACEFSTYSVAAFAFALFRRGKAPAKRKDASLIR